MAIGPIGSRGLSGVAKRSEEIKSSRQGFGLRKFTTEFRWDGSKPPAENALYIRVLGDDIIISTQMHRFVPLPEKKFFNGVCRKAFPIGADFCHVCDVVSNEFTGDNKERKRNGLIPTDVAVALAVEQEPVVVKGEAVGYKAKMVEFEIPQITDGEKSGDVSADSKAYRELLNGLGAPGSKVSIPNIGLMIGTLSGKQALFDYAVKKSSISDRVYEISRYGKGLETDWLWEHEGKDREMLDPAPLLKEYLAKYPFELPEEWAIRNGSEDRYNFFFKLDSGSSDDTTVKVADATPDAGEEVASSSRDQLMKRLGGLGGNS